MISRVKIDLNSKEAIWKGTDGNYSYNNYAPNENDNEYD